MKREPITFEQVFALVLLLLLGGVLAVLAFHTIPKDNMTPFVAISTGVIGAGVGTYIGFIWGSAKKVTDAPAPATSAPPAPPAPPAPEV